MNMKSKNLIISYDKKSDMLYVKKASRPISHSLDIGEMIVDFDSSNRVVGLEVFNFSKILKVKKSEIDDILNARILEKRNRVENLMIVGVYVLVKLQKRKKIEIELENRIKIK